MTFKIYSIIASHPIVHHKQILQYFQYFQYRMSMLRLILGGILAIPCLLVTVCVAPLLAILAIPPLCLLLLRKAPSGLSPTNPPDHVIIAGGSSGIGLCLAKECIARGVPKITILARNPTKLAAAQQELEQAAQLQPLLNEDKVATQIQTISVSVSDLEALKQAAASLKITPTLAAATRVALFNCAGISYTTEFTKIPAETCLKLVQTNQLGSMFLVQAFLPYLERGVICLTSSVAGQAGVYGYAAYTPTKAAIVGFANVLCHELLTTKPNLHIQVAFPADTNTPGYEEEIKMMPKITKALNETTGLANPQEYVQCVFLQPVWVLCLFLCDIVSYSLLLSPTNNTLHYTTLHYRIVLPRPWPMLLFSHIPSLESTLI